MTNSNDIWADDLLGRKAEAEMLHEVLVMEAEECSRAGRDHAFVLALDAAYGEGKTFFLNGLRKHLGREHPVAFVDAWVDDASDEPLLAIMSAINEALEPFLTPGSNAAKWLRNATTAALPIIGKVAVGAFTNFVKKQLGNDIPDEVGALLNGETKPKPGVAEETALDAIGEAGAEISSLADKMGAEMLAAYKARQTSKSTFKRNMRGLVAAIDGSEGKVRKPLFVVIDELDRCRPDYAIKVLEEVKHLFDIPGVVFIIAIHGDQLEKSIAAVYGAEFNAKAYLHRFFSRRYKLRRLTLRELVAARVAADDLDKIEWNFPSIERPQGGPFDTNLVDIITAFCADHIVTPREFASICDGLRFFGRTWNESPKIELIYLLGLLVRSVRALAPNEPIETQGHTIMHDGWDNSSGRPISCGLNDLWRTYESMKSIDFSDLYKSNHGLSNSGFVIESMKTEHNKRFGNSVTPGVTSLINTYADRVARFGRMLEQA